jgi:mono/diheme cytochrome c family protein
MKLFGKTRATVFLAAGLAATLMVLPWVVTAYAQAPGGGQTPAVEAGRGGGARGGAGARGARGGVGTNPPPTSAVTGNAAAGKKLYFEYSCYACHGYNGETGARPFVGNWGNLQTEAGFIAFLRLRGDRASVTPSTSMPNYPETTLSDKQAKDIYAHIRTFKSNSPEIKDIPTLNTIVNAASQPYKP